MERFSAPALIGQPPSPRNKTRLWKNNCIAAWWFWAAAIVSIGMVYADFCGYFCQLIETCPVEIDAVGHRPTKENLLEITI